MVVIAEIWMDHSLKEAIKIAQERNVAIPRALCLYMDDSFGILKQNSTKSAHIEFAACLTDVDERLRFTFEIEEDGKLPFLDALLMREPDGSLSTKVYRKTSNTGLTINPRSNQDPTAWIGVFKSALCRAYRVCSNETLIKEEIEFLINNFEDNGFDRHKLRQISKEYRPPELTIVIAMIL